MEGEGDDDEEVGEGVGDGLLGGRRLALVLRRLRERALHAVLGVFRLEVGGGLAEPVDKSCN